MKQQCHLSMIGLSWALYLGGLAWTVAHRDWTLAILWLVLAPLAQWQLIRRFPSISALLGFGSVADQHASIPASSMPVCERVILYTARGCPFSPILERRLEVLSIALGFSIEKIDVTFRPGLRRAKGIQAVPAVEIHGAIFTGLRTSHELATLLTEQRERAAA